MKLYKIMENASANRNLAIPAAIIIAGLIVAGSVFYSSRDKSPTTAKQDQKQKEQILEKPEDRVKVFSGQDHILGNPDAPVKIIEFSDTECPFCKQFHPTMHQIIDEYGKTGKVAWVYRHFPIDQLHPKARKEAEATECANELGGNNKFWSYLDRLFEITPSNNNLDLTKLTEIAQDVGLDRAQFDTCLKSGKYAGRIQADIDDAVNSGANGTPYSITVAQNGKKFIINGAQSYAFVKSIVEAALQEK